MAPAWYWKRAMLDINDYDACKTIINKIEKRGQIEDNSFLNQFGDVTPIRMELAQLTESMDQNSKEEVIKFEEAYEDICTKSKFNLNSASAE